MLLLRLLALATMLSTFLVYSRVKLAMDSEGNYVAVKKYKKDTADLKTLRHELNIMRNLNHNNLVKLIDVR